MVEAAVMVTVPALDGAWYVVEAPLAVCAGVKVPQLGAGVQLQSTPAFSESPFTVAAIEAVWPEVRVAGGAVVIETVGAPIVTVAVSTMLGCAVEAAVIVTVPALAGA